MAKIRTFSLGIGQSAVLQQAQQQTQHIRMCFFHLVKQHDRARMSANFLGQLSAFSISFVAGRCADEPRNIVRLLIL